MKTQELQEMYDEMFPDRDRQLDREIEQANAAIETYERRQEQQLKDGKAHVTNAGHTLIKDLIGPLTLALQADMDAQAAITRSGRRREWFKLLAETGLTARALATIAGRVAADSVFHDFGLTSNQRNCGRLVEYNINMNRYQEADKRNQDYVIRKARKSRSDFAAKNVMIRGAERADVDLVSWTDEQATKVGGWLLGWVCEVSPYVETAYVATKYHDAKSGKIKHARRRILALTPVGKELVEDSEIVRKDALFQYWPMITAPIDWESPEVGGYLRDDRALMVRKASQALTARLTDDPPEMVLQALNIAQRVSHRINKPVFEVMRTAYDRGLDLFSDKNVEMLLPELPLWEGPEWDDCTEDEQKAKLKFNQNLEVIEAERREIASRRGSIEAALDAAQRDLEEDSLYFVHSLDRRGRLYPNGSGVSPQGAKFEKALIEAAEGEPIGDDNGPFWLAVHIANCFGGADPITPVDKMSYEDRVVWFEANEEELLADVASPFRHNALWMKAESPFEFLAGAFAWAGYLLEGPSYKCRIAVARDGSNSGLQHFSALMRDEAGAGRVNVSPSELPADVYRDVMVLVHNSLDSYRPGDDGYESAEQWRTPDENGEHRVTRSVCKRPVMTFYYSVKPTGMRDQILEKMPESWITKRTPEGRKQRTELAAFLANELRDAIVSLSPKAAAGMEYLKGLTNVILKADREMRWVTPLNFPVWQKYYHTKYDRKHKVWEGSELNQQHIPEVDETAPRPAKNKNAISPNFIHSLDATHLMMVIDRLDYIGVNYLRAVHDSIAVLPNHVDELDFILRDEFVNLYAEQDWLSDLEAQVRQQLDHDDEAQDAIDMLADLRVQGGLDIEEVRNSEYFFA
jgi:DNA-directed RNA polymerase